MSVNGDEGRKDVISISAYTDFEDDDEALEALVNVKELDFGDVFTDRNTTLDSDETEGLSIEFYHAEQANQLQIHTTGSGHIHIAGTISGKHFDDADGVLRKILDEVGEISIENLSVVVYRDIEFSSLKFPIESDTSYDVSGIRITKEDAHYIVQETDRQGSTFVNRSRRVDDNNRYEDLTPVGNSDIEAIDQFLEEFE